MNPVRTTIGHTLYRSPICVHPLCSSEDIESMKDDGAQIIPVSTEISVAYLCKECFSDLPVREVITLTRNYLNSERGLFKKRFWQWKRGFVSSDPSTHLEASVRFLRGELGEPPFLSPAFLHSKMILGHPKIIHREHLALISFT